MANLLTIFRLCLIPLFVILIYSKYFTTAFIIFTLAALTDAFDGIIARRTGKVTELGKRLDPLADRLLVAAVTITLVLVKILPLWVLLVIGIRDLVMILGYVLLRYRNISPPEITLVGKTSSTFLSISMALFILRFKLAYWFLYPGIALSLISGLDYVNKGNSKMKKLSKVSKTKTLT